MSSINRTAFYHQAHREWLSTLDFYQNEILTFRKELERVLLHYSDSFSIVEHVNEYEDIFNKKIIQIDTFRRKIMRHEKQLKEEWSDEKTALGSHEELDIKINDFFMNFEILKTNFKRFVAKHFRAKT